MSQKAVLFSLAALLILAVPAWADWDPSQPFKWVQFPDLSATGIDVNASNEFILADDFECTQPGPLTDIHLWGSWLYDHLPFDEDPLGVRFILSIPHPGPDIASIAVYIGKHNIKRINFCTS